LNPNRFPKSGANLPPGIWALGFVSLFMDVSSELIHSLLPLFMATVLGASMTTIGIIEGIAEATASIAKVFSGALSDWLGKRKLLLLVGYGLSALTKPMFPLAGSIATVFAARFADRVGKGIRGAPRDALVADLTPREQRGAAYGLRQAMDSAGAVIGPLLALAGMAMFAGDITTVLWIGVVPAGIAVLVLATVVREPTRAAASTVTSKPLQWRQARRLPWAFWMVVLLGFVFTLARFSEAFLVLRASDAGMSLAAVPLVMVVMSAAFAAASYPAGRAADRIDRRLLLVAGMVVLALADLLLALATDSLLVLAAAALWGLHMGLTQGLLSALVADTAPSRLRGTGFGIFNLVAGVALVLASLIAGILWDTLGAAATFLVGGALALLAATGVLIEKRLTS